MNEKAKKTDFKNTLKHGKCKGRIQLHNRRIHPYYCVNENAGEPLHECPDQDGFWVHKEKRCNCCDECKTVCIQTHLIKERNAQAGIFDEWKKFLK